MRSKRAPSRWRRRGWLGAIAAVLVTLAAGPLGASGDALTIEAVAAGSEVATDEAFCRTAAWPPWRLQHRPTLSTDCQTANPHPAVARIIVPEKGATAYGTGTLIDVRDEYGLVVTNWHVVRDSQGVVEVVFPSGFRSHARPLKVDSDWDLAALVIWRPPIEPVPLADRPPRPGDRLTIHGYGQGQYRIAVGQCTTYYAPRIDFPQEMVELDVEAREGDSGGPIFNDRGHLAGVLFGAGQGTTIGSFGPRVASFLASLAPDIGAADDQALVAVADRPAPNVRMLDRWSGGDRIANAAAEAGQQLGRAWTSAASSSTPRPAPDAHVQPRDADNIRLAGTTAATASAANELLSWQDVAGSGWFERAKTLLALVGIVAVVLQLVKTVR